MTKRKKKKKSQRGKMSEFRASKCVWNQWSAHYRGSSLSLFAVADHRRNTCERRRISGKHYRVTNLRSVCSLSVSERLQRPIKEHLGNLTGNATIQLFVFYLCAYLLLSARCRTAQIQNRFTHGDYSNSYFKFTDRKKKLAKQFIHRVSAYSTWRRSCHQHTYAFFHCVYGRH